MSNGFLGGGLITPDLSKGIPVESISILVEDDSSLPPINKYLQQELILQELRLNIYEQIEQDLREYLFEGLNAQIHWMFSDSTDNIQVQVLLESAELVDSLAAQISISLPDTVLERLTPRSIKTINRTLRRMLEKYEPVIKIGTSYVPTSDNPNWVQTIYLLAPLKDSDKPGAPNEELATSIAHAELFWLMDRAQSEQAVMTEQVFQSTLEQNAQAFQAVVDRYLPSNSSVQFSVSRELTSVKKYQLVISCVVKETGQEKDRTPITDEVFAELGNVLAEELQRVLNCPNLMFLPDSSQSFFKQPIKVSWRKKSKTDYTAMFHTFHFRVQ